MQVIKKIKPRQRLLNAAGRLFWAGGFYSTSVEKICEDAGVNKANFYRYFPSKDDLATEIIKGLGGFAEEDVFKRAVEDADSPMDAINLVFLNTYQLHYTEKLSCGHSPGCPVMNLGAEIAPFNDEVAAEVNRYIKKIEVFFEKLIQDAVEQKEIAPIGNVSLMAKDVYAVLVGAVQVAKVKNDPKVIKDSIRIAKSLLGAR